MNDEVSCLNFALLALHYAATQRTSLPTDLHNFLVVGFYAQYTVSHANWYDQLNALLCKVFPVVKDSISTFGIQALIESDPRPLREAICKESEQLKVYYAQLLVLILVSDNNYDSRSAMLVAKMKRAMKLSEETFTNKVLTIINDIRNDDVPDTSNTDGNNASNASSSMKRKLFYAGTGATVGALVVSLSAGLVAPVVIPAMASLFGISMTGGTFSGLFGMAGAGMGAWKMKRRLGGIKEFELVGISQDGTAEGSARNVVEKERVELVRLEAMICVSGWLTGRDSIRAPWARTLLANSNYELFAVQWETKTLLKLGNALGTLVTNTLLTFAGRQVIMRTALAAAASALMWPVAVLQLGDVIDNPWSMGLDRARKAGLVLADAIRSRAVGCRPVTLVGYSLGALVCWSCLKDLVKTHSFGLVKSVLLMGLPATIDKAMLFQTRCIVSDRFIHAYSTNDWVLQFLYRASHLEIRKNLAGLNPIDDVPGIESIDISRHINGHTDYENFPIELLDLLS